MEPIEPRLEDDQEPDLMTRSAKAIQSTFKKPDWNAVEEQVGDKLSKDDRKEAIGTIRDIDKLMQRRDLSVKDKKEALIMATNPETMSLGQAAGLALVNIATLAIGAGISGAAGGAAAGRIGNEQTKNMIDMYGKQADLRQKGAMLRAQSAQDEIDQVDKQFGTIAAREEKLSDKAQERAFQISRDLVRGGMRKEEADLKAQADAKEWDRRSKITFDRDNQKIKTKHDLKTEVAKGSKYDVDSWGQKDREQYVPGWGFAGNAASANDLKKQKTDMENGMNVASQLLALTKTDIKNLSPKEVMNLQTRAKVLSQKLVGLSRQEFLGPGIMDKNERRILESIISNPGKLFSLDANSITSLETVLSGMQSNYDLTKKNGIIRKLTLSKSDFANLSEEEAERFVELGGDLK